MRVFAGMARAQMPFLEERDNEKRDECICMLFRVEVGFGQGHHMSLLRLDVFSGCKGRAAT